MTDIEWLACAYTLASAQSTDPSTQNAAILVRDGLILCQDVNRFPRGVNESGARWERPSKYDYIEHAERNVIYKAANFGIRTAGATMYCPWYACANCARAIIAAGIERVVGHVMPERAADSRWGDSIKIAIQMFHEAGVKAEWLEGKIGAPGVRFDGKVVYP